MSGVLSSTRGVAASAVFAVCPGGGTRALFVFVVCNNNYTLRQQKALPVGKRVARRREKEAGRSRAGLPLLKLGQQDVEVI